MSLSVRQLVAAMALVVGALIGASGALAAPPAPKPPFPQIELPQASSQGQRAIDLLGNRLPEVARWYGKSPEEFRALLLNDRRLRIDRRGRLFVVEELEHEAPAASEPQGLLDGQLAPLEQTYFLHSRPGAKRTIYLNFRGALLSNTAWNGSSGTLTALPFDLDGVPYSNSTAELQRIQYIWQRVAEDFAPFDVNVTTEAPPPEALTRSTQSDDTFGTTVLITHRSGVYSCNCGGVAYIGIFDDTTDYYKPALVFYDALGGGNEKSVAEAISHEAGHNLGLLHDGFSGGSYYGGHGTGATGWAPIMGVGYSKSLVQWSKGEYATATNTQDDYVVMQATGLPLRADDHGNTAATASSLATVTAAGVHTFSGSGVIERPTDVDVFAFTAGAGAASFNVLPAARSPNVDLQIELRSSSGALLASANPVEALSASLSVALPAAGTYTLHVRGTGMGDPMTTGYSNYGSTGLYAISGSANAGVGLPPQAVITASTTRGTAPLTVNFSGAGSSDPDGSIVSHAWAFGDGVSASGVTASHTYTTAGSYTATLQVTDNSGLSASTSTVITVDPVVAVTTMSVADIAMSLGGRGKSTSATAAVRIRDAQGQPVPGATVSGRWSGVVSGNVSGVTGSDGIVVLKSKGTRGSGTFTFTVTDVRLDGFSYQPQDNVETSDSISN